MRVRVTILSVPRNCSGIISNGKKHEHVNISIFTPKLEEHHLLSFVRICINTNNMTCDSYCDIMFCWNIPQKLSTSLFHGKRNIKKADKFRKHVSCFYSQGGNANHSNSFRYEKYRAPQAFLVFKRCRLKFSIR